MLLTLEYSAYKTGTNGTTTSQTKYKKHSKSLWIDIVSQLRCASYFAAFNIVFCNKNAHGPAFLQICRENWKTQIKQFSTVKSKL